MSDQTAPSFPMETQEDEEEPKDVPAAAAPPPSSTAAASPAMNPPASSSSTKKLSQKRALDDPFGFEADPCPDDGNMNKKRKDDDIAIESFASSSSNVNNELAVLEKMVSFYRTHRLQFNKRFCTHFLVHYQRLKDEYRKANIQFPEALDRQAVEMAHELFRTLDAAEPNDEDEQARHDYNTGEEMEGLTSEIGVEGQGTQEGLKAEEKFDLGSEDVKDSAAKEGGSQEKKKENVGAESADVEMTEVPMEEKDQKDEASSEEQDSMSI